MSGRYDYVKYDEQAIAEQDWFKNKFLELSAAVDDIKCGRSKALVHTKLEEAYMWIGKGIRNDQIARNGSAPLQEERKDDKITYIKEEK